MFTRFDWKFRTPDDDIWILNGFTIVELIEHICEINCKGYYLYERLKSQEISQH